MWCGDAHERLPAFEPAEAAAALRHVMLEQEGLEAENPTAQEMVARLETQLTTIAKDMAREEHVLQDAAQQEKALAEEEATITNAASSDEAEMEARARAEWRRPHKYWQMPRRGWRRQPCGG